VTGSAICILIGGTSLAHYETVQFNVSKTWQLRRSVLPGALLSLVKTEIHVGHDARVECEGTSSWGFRKTTVKTRNSTVTLIHASERLSNMGLENIAMYKSP
jgi:hypothetical protein